MNKKICPICSTIQKTIYLGLNSFRIIKCDVCGLFWGDYADNELKEGYQRVNIKAYDRSIAVVRKKQAQFLVSHIESTRANAKWLDIGCGPGYLINEAKCKGFDTYGIELDEIAYQKALEVTGPLHVSKERFSSKSFNGKNFEVISTINLLEHIPLDELSQFCNAIYDRLVPNGHWTIIVPTSSGLFFRVSNYLFKKIKLPIESIIRRLWNSEYQYPHTLYFNLDNLSHLLLDHGFTIEISQYVDDVPNSTIIDRLSIDETIPKILIPLFAFGILSINLFSKLYGKTDLLYVLARKIN